MLGPLIELSSNSAPLDRPADDARIDPSVAAVALVLNWLVAATAIVCVVAFAALIR